MGDSEGKTNFNPAHHLELYEYVGRTCRDPVEADCGIYHIPNGTCCASQIFNQGQGQGQGEERGVGVQRERHSSDVRTHLEVSLLQKRDS